MSKWFNVVITALGSAALAGATNALTADGVTPKKVGLAAAAGILTGVVNLLRDKPKLTPEP